MIGLYANVIIDISHEKVDRPFQYIIPESLRGQIEVGNCVDVYFGNGNKLKQAFVIEITDKNEYPPDKLKSIVAISDHALGVDQDAIKLALWIKDTYGSTMIAALKTVLPVKKKVKNKEDRRIVRKMDRDSLLGIYAEAIRKNQKARIRVLEELKEEEILPYDLVVTKLNVSRSTLDNLTRDGVISIESNIAYRNPVKVTEDQDFQKLLSEEQEAIARDILKDIDEGISVADGAGKYLIHGITGSGKTEVYLEIIEQVIKRGKQCIMLIPEIALTYQTLMRFYKRFGDRVSVINSSLSMGERYDQCQRAKNGEIDVIIGPRSALFVPFPNLGLVIIDEEHEGSYISESTPRYHAKETAQELCRIKKASLVLGSATPSIDSYYRAKCGEYKLYKLTKRLTGGELPTVEVVDLRQELRSGNRSILSKSLQTKMADRLNKGQQIMLFLNRRGIAGFVSCRECGHVMKCPHCDVSLTRHKQHMLKCHYCGYETQDVNICPSCGSKYISGFKAGTQQVEEAINKLYPQARILRMDADTTKEKDSYEKILSTFKDGEADILLGTQMIVKGHDFPNVTLVGVLAADMSLNEADFRTAERTFQLLCQAVGRAGRGQLLGEAVIQTYRPEHYSIQYAKDQDYEGFYEEERAYRIVGDYPPAGAMLQIQVLSKDDRRALGLSVALKKKATENVRVIGPAPDGISKVNDYYRYNLFIKSSDMNNIIKCREIMENYLETAPLETELVSFDVK